MSDRERWRPPSLAERFQLPRFLTADEVDEPPVPKGERCSVDGGSCRISSKATRELKDNAVLVVTFYCDKCDRPIELSSGLVSPFYYLSALFELFGVDVEDSTRDEELSYVGTLLDDLSGELEVYKMKLAAARRKVIDQLRVRLDNMEDGE